MDIVLIPLYHVLDTLVGLYIWILIITVVLSWLLTFGVINTYNQFVASVSDFLFRITEPVLQPIRRLLPNLGGIDISPVLLIIGLFFLREVMARLVIRLTGAG